MAGKPKKPAAAQKTDPKMGRPSKYRPELCAMLIRHMSAGRSIDSFAAQAGVHRTTLYEWKDVHPEWAEALEMGEALSYEWWEKAYMNAMLGRKITLPEGEVVDFSKANASLMIFGMKNRFKWRDRHDVEVAGKDGAPIETKNEIKLTITDYRAKK